MLAEHASGWNGRPGLAGSRSGQGWSPLLALTGFELAGGRVVATGADAVAGLEVRLEIELLPSGLVRQRGTVTTTADGTYTVDGLTLTLARAAGRDGAVRPRRPLGPASGPRSGCPFVVGVHSRENRRGRTGPDAPLILAAGTAGFDTRQRRDLGRARGVERQPRHLRRAAQHR